MPILRPRVVARDMSSTGRIMVAAGDQDSLLSAIVKWIPVEVLTVYKTLDGFIPPDKYFFRVAFTASCTVICALWIAFATKPEDKQIAWRQVILAPFAFLCWSVAMETDLLKHLYPAWEAWVGSVVLGAGTLFLPIFDGILRRLGVPQSQ